MWDELIRARRKLSQDEAELIEASCATMITSPDELSLRIRFAMSGLLCAVTLFVSDAPLFILVFWLIFALLFVVADRLAGWLKTRRQLSFLRDVLSARSQQIVTLHWREPTEEELERFLSDPKSGLSPYRLEHSDQVIVYRRAGEIDHVDLRRRGRPVWSVSLDTVLR